MSIASTNQNAVCQISEIGFHFTRLALQRVGWIFFPFVRVHYRYKVLQAKPSFARCYMDSKNSSRTYNKDECDFFSLDIFFIDFVCSFITMYTKSMMNFWLVLSILQSLEKFIFFYVSKQFKTAQKKPV